MIQALDDSKRRLRKELRDRIRAVSAEELHDRSALAAHLLCETPVFRKACAIMIFMPMKDEIDARPISLKAWQEDMTVTVPLVGEGQNHMIPVSVHSLDDPMEVDRMGVRVPSRCEPFPIQMLDLVVVPGLGFDRQGCRLGRGGGFYDRFLAHPEFRARTCGLALDEQLLEQIPAGEHDRSVDMVVTDKRVVRCRKR